MTKPTFNFAPFGDSFFGIAIHAFIGFMDVTITVTFPTDVTIPFLQKIGGWYVTCCITSLAKSKSENPINEF